MDITAHHAHLFPSQVRPDGDLPHLLNMLDECGIDDCVAFAPFAAQMHRQDISPSRWLFEELRGCKRVYGFGTVDFARDDLREQVDEIVDLGFRGIKIHPAMQHISVFGEKAKQVYERAQDKGLFITFHTGVHWERIANYNVLLFDEVAYHYPQLKFSMEHIGGYSFVREALAVLANNSHRGKREQVYAGFTSIFDPVKNRLWYLSEAEREQAVHMAGERCVIFGLDFPYNKTEDTQRAIQCIQAMPFSEEVKSGILGGNLRRVLGLEEK